MREDGGSGECMCEKNMGYERERERERVGVGGDGLLKGKKPIFCKKKWILFF